MQGFSDVDGNTLSVSNLTATNGILTNHGNGTYSFSPNANYNGTVNLSYNVIDSNGGSVAATQSFNLAAVNDAPTGTVTITGTASQGQTLTASNNLADVDGLGTISYQWQADGTNITGATSDSFTLTQDQVGKAITVLASYTDNQGTGESVASAATGNVANINDSPTGTASTTLTPGTEDTPYTITTASLLTGFSDVDGDTLSVSGLTANNGNLVNNNNGTYTFTPNANYNGTVNLSYNVIDGNGGSVAATQSFSLAAVNDAPVVTAPSTTQSVDTNTNIPIAGISIADVDAGSSPVQVTLAASHGVLSLNSTAGITFTIGDGSQDANIVFNGTLANINAALNNLTYRSLSGYSGLDNITLTVNDNGNSGSGGSLSDSKAIPVLVYNPIIGTTASNTLTATVNPDRIFADAGNDTVNATVANAQQNDIFDGGTGTDTLVMTGGDANTTLTLNVANGTDQLSGIPGLTVKNFETFNFSGFQGTLSATGGTGNDNISGGAGNDTLDGGDGNDTLNRGVGNDILIGGAGTNTLVGGTGDDTYIISTTTNTITEAAGAGTDTVLASVTYTLATNVENLTLTGTGNINGTGNSLNNTLIGNSGNNVLDGGTGSDTMSGGLGNDTYVVDNAGDVVIENSGEGTDLVQSSISYSLTANVENLTITGTGNINGTGNDLNNTLGNTGANTLDGGDGNDILTGGNGNDILVGGNGNDILTGGNGNDTLTGGNGNDKFVYNAFSERTDIITDFNTTQDILDLRGLFSSLGSTPVISDYLKFTQSGANTLVQIDQNGAVGGASFTTLTTLNGVTASGLSIGTNVLVV